MLSSGDGGRLSEMWMVEGAGRPFSFCRLEDVEMFVIDWDKVFSSEDVSG
jgi:hypothetical protein